MSVPHWKQRELNTEDTTLSSAGRLRRAQAVAKRAEEAVDQACSARDLGIANSAKDEADSALVEAKRADEAWRIDPSSGLQHGLNADIHIQAAEALLEQLEGRAPIDPL